MNQNLLKINDNYGLVTDDNGNIKIISKENNTTAFTTILNKENNLERLNNKLQFKEESLLSVKNELNKVKSNLTDNTIDTIAGEITNLILLAVEILIYIYGNNKFTLPELLIPMGSLYIIYKGITIAKLGTRLERYTKRVDLKAYLSSLEKDKLSLEKEITYIKHIIPKLESSLDTLKESSLYKDNQSNLEQSKTNHKIKILKLKK